MSDIDTVNRIDLVDNTETSNMSDAKENAEEQQQQPPQEQNEDTQPEQNEQGMLSLISFLAGVLISELGAWYSKPEGMGNKAGDKIQDTLSPVGNVVGKGAETVAAPIGGITEPLLGGIMKGGKAWGEQLGVGYGNAEGGPAKAQEAEAQRMKEPVGGQEQTAENPLGL